jgi:transcriptional regulator with XRE-family HTH domain
MVNATDIKYAQRLRGLRLINNIKQEQAFELIGLSSQQEYSKLENGKLNFTDELINCISDTFKITSEEFVNSSQLTSILNSPNSFNHSQNNTINDKDVIEQLIKSKDETITALKKQVELLEHVLNNK